MLRETFRSSDSPAPSARQKTSEVPADGKFAALAAVRAAHIERAGAKAGKLSAGNAAKAIRELDAGKIAAVFAHIGITAPGPDGKSPLVDDQKAGMKIKPLLKGGMGGDQWRKIMGELRGALKEGGGELGKPLAEALGQLFVARL